MQPTHGDYDITETEGYTILRNCIHAINRMSKTRQADALAELLLNGHEGTTGYLGFGNHKVANNTAILNMNSATDCPNADSDKDNPTETGVCQVPWEACYAHKSENMYPDTLKKRRLQEFLWDSFGAGLWAAAILRVQERMRSEFTYLRISESGDFRHNGDITKWDAIAGIISPDIQAYTYSASHRLDAWDSVENLTVNQSNDLADYGDRLFSAVETVEDIPDDAIFCPFEAAAKNGVPAEERPKCGECTACIEPESEQPRDVYITIH
jgi:hypothetical protein